MRRVASVLVGLLIGASAVACGSGEDSATPSTTTAAAAATTTTDGGYGDTTAAPGTEDSEVAATVQVVDFSYSPASVTIKAGETVEWVFADAPVPHDVVGTSDNTPDGFASEKLTEGTFTFTFTEPGEYEYFCSIHPQMIGKVIVEA